MSGCLVSRYSIARLWFEWKALETWEATLAVSYVPLAAWVCNTCSLLSIHQQSKLWLVNHFSGWHFPWWSLATQGRGVFHQTAHCKLSLSAPPIASVNSWTLCALVWWKHSDLLFFCACFSVCVCLWNIHLNALNARKEEFSSSSEWKWIYPTVQAVKAIDLKSIQGNKIKWINLHYWEYHNPLLTVLEIRLGNFALFDVLLLLMWLI